MQNLLKSLLWKVTLDQELLGNKSRECCNSLLRGQKRRDSTVNLSDRFDVLLNCNFWLYHKQTIC